MTKKRLESYRRLYNRLEQMGFDADEVETLLRIERTLSRWAELECGDGDDYASWAIERNEATGKPYLVTYPHSGAGNERRSPVPDREAGAKRRLAKLMSSHPKYIAYHQTDPRGCALYIVDAGENPPETLESSYTNGVAVYV